MIRRPPRSTRKESSAASDVYKRQALIADAPSLSRLSAPLLLYHPLQLLIDSTLTSAMKQYISGVPIEENETQ